MNKIIVTILILSPFYSLAQVDWEDPKGAIKNEEVIIEKDKQIILPSVSRRFTAITVDPLTIDTSAIKYTPKEIDANLPKIPVKLRPKVMKSEALNKTYWGNFKAGYGSYVSPYFQADIASKRSDEYALSLHFKHFSSKNGPVDADNSGLSNTDAFLSGKLFFNKATLGAKVGGKFDTYHLYGYGANPVPESNDIRQRLSDYSLGISITDNDKNDSFFYAVNGGVNIFNAKDLTWNETDVFLDFDINLSVSNGLYFKLEGGVHAASQENTALVTNNKRMIYVAKPIGVYAYESFEFEVGAGLNGVKDPINSYNQKVYIIPHVVARYKFGSGHTISGGVKGDVTWKSMRTEFNQNPYLGVATVINSVVKPIDVFIEANGKIAPKIDFTLGYHTSVYKVFGQYVNDPSDLSTFTIDYQTTNNLIHSFTTQVDFITNKNLLLTLYGKYRVFSFDLLEQPYHVPNIDLGFKAKFNVVDKLDTEIAFTYLDGIYAQNFSATSIDVKLNSIFDVNLAANYKINNSLSVFLKMQNILGNQYQYYYRYPSKGFQVLAGVSFTL
jgi:hypothetical protein